MPKLITTNYNPQELKLIKIELAKFTACRNENIPKETVEAWINAFSELNMSAKEIIKRIKLAKLQKKYSVSEFSNFIEVNISDYGKYYKHEKPEQKKYSYAIPVYHVDGLTLGKRYEVIETIHDSVLIVNDSNLSSFYDFKYFNLFETKNIENSQKNELSILPA